jgi:hypothetical protein
MHEVQANNAYFTRAEATGKLDRPPNYASSWP